MNHNFANFKTSNTILVVVISVLCGLIVCHFYDQFWWPQDDGAYAYVADLLNRGAILHRDIQDVHMGYINFTNSIALKWFGDDFISMRYPIMLLTVIQSVLIFTILISSGKLVATTGAILMTALTFIQYINPTAHWYTLFLIVLIVYILHTTESSRKYRIELIGFLLMVLFCYRQLSGAFAVIGVVSYLIYEYKEMARQRFADTIIGKIVLCVFLGILILYLGNKTSLTSFFLFGIFPIGVLVLLIKNSHVPNVVMIRMMTRLFIGSIIGIFPIVLYHLINGSIQIWLQDTVINAIGMTNLKLFDNAYYLPMLVMSIKALVTHESISVMLNGLLWIIILFSPGLYGILLLKRMQKNRNKIKALGFIPVFYMLVSVHYEIPIYLFYSSAFTFTALLWLFEEHRHRTKMFVSAGLLSICIVAIVFQAGQPLDRRLGNTIKGTMINERYSCDIPHCSVYTDKKMVNKYKRLIAFVLENTTEEDTLLTIPSMSAVNYISKRVSPLRFYNTSLGIRNGKDINDAILKLKKSNTRMVFIEPKDKYTTPLMGKLISYVRENYRLLDQIDGVEVYILISHESVGSVS